RDGRRARSARNPCQHRRAGIHRHSHERSRVSRRQDAEGGRRPDPTRARRPTIRGRRADRLAHLAGCELCHRRLLPGRRRTDVPVGVSASTSPRDAIGRTRAELLTPALVLDLDVMRENVATMAAWARSHVAVRPHFKTHKCIQIAREQLDAGAIGITCATVWEARALVEAGIDEILIANEVSPAKVPLLAELARRSHMTVAVDDADGASALAAEVRSRGAE